MSGICILYYRVWVAFKENIVYLLKSQTTCKSSHLSRELWDNTIVCPPTFIVHPPVLLSLLLAARTLTSAFYPSNHSSPPTCILLSLLVTLDWLYSYVCFSATILVTSFLTGLHLPNLLIPNYIVPALRSNYNPCLHGIMEKGIQRCSNIGLQLTLIKPTNTSVGIRSLGLEYFCKCFRDVIFYEGAESKGVIMDFQGIKPSIKMAI